MIKFMRRILFIYLTPYWKQSLLLFLCLISLVAFDTLFPLGTKFLIDQAIVPKNGRMFALLAAGLAVLYLLSSAGSLEYDYLIAWVSARVLNDMRLKMFAHLQDLPVSFYNQLPHGDVATRFNVDLGAIEYALAYSVFPGIQGVLQLIISVIVLFMLDVPLGALTLITLPLVALLPKLLADRASVLVSQRRVEETRITSAVEESLQAHTVNRMFGLRDFAIAAFSHQLDRFASIATRSSFLGWEVNRATNVGQYLIQLLVIGIGGYLVFIGRMSVGSWVGFTSLLISMGYAVSMVSTAFAGLIPATASLERVESLLNENNPIIDHPDIPVAPFSQEICFRQVTFSYAGPAGKPNLERVDLCIPRGQSVAFVGRSGSGKSTVLNLLMRFYEPDAGRILLDGHAIQEVSLASLRAQMGVVFQDTFLFNISLRENIRLGRIAASDAEVEQTARAAGVHDTIMGLPGGYDTLAGEQGRGLSGGQRQRIALARAIIRRPPILLLDEATSALDPETEAQIYDTLNTLHRTCTILTVTHRLAPIVDMDQIVVMDSGRAIDAGTHAELMNRCGKYRQLFTQQSGFTVSPDGLYADVRPARLRNIPLFAELDEAALEELAAQFTTERYEAGCSVVKYGEVGDKFYIIVRGKMTVSVSGADQQAVEVNTLQDGDYFGEIALLEERQRTATVCAVLPSLCLTLERKHFLNMLARNPQLRTVIEHTAKERLGESSGSPRSESA